MIIVKCIYGRDVPLFHKKSPSFLVLLFDYQLLTVARPPFSPLGIIDKEGPGGTFLQVEHTLKHFKEIWYPKLINRDTHDKWVRDGSRSLGEVLNERVKWILDNHKAEPLIDEVQGKIEKILEVAGKSQSSAQ